MRVFYITSQWGAPTETFVRREVRAAVGTGAEVILLSLKRPRHDVLAEVVDDPRIIHLTPARTLARALAQFLRSPRRVVVTIARSLRLSRRSTMLPNLGATIVGLGAASFVRECDWIHAHFAWVAATAASAASAVSNVPFGVSVHAFDVYDENVVDSFLRHKLQTAALVTVESERIAADVRDRFACRPIVVRIGLPRSIMTSRVAVDFRRPPLVLSVGTLVTKKGHDVLIRAIPLTRHGWVCRIAGAGSGRDHLEALAHAVHASDRVALLGALPESDVLKAMDDADVFCLASRVAPSGDRDGVPNVLIEALGRGLPAISTDVSGIPDLLGGGRGVIVPPEDPEALARALDELFEQPDRAAAIAKAGNEWVRAHYVAEDNWLTLEHEIRKALVAGA